MRIGVVGYAAPTGIGYLCRRLVRKLPAVEWLVPAHRRTPSDSGPEDVVIKRLPPDRANSQRTVMQFVSSVDAIVSIERTWPDSLFNACRHYGVRSVLLVMGEWFNPRIGKTADCLVAPTKLCSDMLQKWGFGRRTVHVPMPLDLGEFAPRVVETADRLAFCDGWGGVGERKGASYITQLLERDPTLLEVRTQRERHWLTGVRVRTASETPAELYDELDACVQPSRWEGLGLQQLESMACGLPVLTTNAPPMNEHCIDAHSADAKHLLVPCAVSQRVVSHMPWPDAVCNIDALFDMTKSLKGSAIRDLSMQARSYIEQRHGESQWEALRQVIRG